MIKTILLPALILFFSFLNNAQNKSNNLITIKILKVEQAVTNSAVYIDAMFTNESLNHLDRFFLNTYVYAKDGQYLGRTVNSITNLPSKKHIIETIFFENVKYNQIKTWEFILDDVLTIKDKRLKYYDDYKVKLIK